MLIKWKTGRIETAQEWLGHTSTAHTRAYIEPEDYREKANGVVAGYLNLFSFHHKHDGAIAKEIRNAVLHDSVYFKAIEPLPLCLTFQR